MNEWMKNRAKTKPNSRAYRLWAMIWITIFFAICLVAFFFSLFAWLFSVTISAADCLRANGKHHLRSRVNESKWVTYCLVYGAVHRLHLHRMIVTELRMELCIVSAQEIVVSDGNRLCSKLYNCCCYCAVAFFSLQFEYCTYNRIHMFVFPVDLSLVSIDLMRLGLRSVYFCYVFCILLSVCSHLVRYVCVCTFFLLFTVTSSAFIWLAFVPAWSELAIYCFSLYCVCHHRFLCKYGQSVSSRQWNHNYLMSCILFFIIYLQVKVKRKKKQKPNFFSSTT